MIFYSFKEYLTAHSKASTADMYAEYKQWKKENIRLGEDELLKNKRIYPISSFVDPITGLPFDKIFSKKMIDKLKGMQK